MKKVMKAEDIVLLLRKVKVLTKQGTTVPLACRESGISEYSYYKLRKGIQRDISQAKEIKRLKEGNARLKKVADLSLDKLIINEVLSGKH